MAQEQLAKEYSPTRFRTRRDTIVSGSTRVGTPRTRRTVNGPGSK
jgi:hypothetical protein